MTLEDFKINTPEPGQILILRDDLYQVKGITIHRTDCSLSSYDSSLNQLTGLTIQIGPGFVVEINSVTKYGSYYYLDVVPFEFLEEPNEEVCETILLEPFNENVSLDFRNSVFYPLYNNVPETLTQAAIDTIYKGKIEIRRGKNIYDVDRKNDAIVPTNITNILEDTANLAEFPESNYSSLSNITGRYLGSKTSISDYGTNPSLGLIQVDASIFNTSITNSTICSQSLSDLVITEASFDSTYNTKPSSNLIPTASRGGLDGFINGTTSSFASITNTQTEMEFTIPNENVYKLKPGAIVYLTNNTQVDYVEVTKVSVVGPQTGWNRTIFNVTVTRGIDGTSTAMDGVFNAPGSGQYEIISIRFIDSDTLYTYEGSKPITISNKKVYFPASGEIYKVGPKGRILYGVGTCN
jgi:hypothetical protein